MFPRIVILAAEPSDPDCEICSPATLPASELARLLSFTVFTFSPETSVTAYPSDFFSLDIPNAVITTSSRSWSDSNTTLIVAESLTVSS